MGCGDPGDRETFAAAYADRGAGYLIGFDNSVSAQFTDSATSTLVTALARGSSIQESVSLASGSDPVYHGQFGFVEASSISQQRIANLLSEISLFATFFILLVFGPLLVFLIPKILARR
jgi:Kef-type K+ transport system membrane component KefB